MTIGRIILLLAALGLVACEQAVLNGPVGGASVKVSELRIERDVITGLVTSSEDSVISAEGQSAWDSYEDLKQLRKLGKHTFEDDSIFADSVWYVMSATGGFDYDSNGDRLLDAPTQVQGTLHALVTGAQIKQSGFALSPLTESAYQFVVDYAELLSDQELQAALDALAAELLDDVDGSGTVDYRDVLSWNRLFDLDTFPPAREADLQSLIDAIALGESDATVQARALALFDSKAPLGVAEALFEADISAIVQPSCGPGCHLPGGSGSNASAHDLTPTSDTNQVALNTDMYRALVQNRGVDYIVTKASGGNAHGGGVRLQSGSADLLAFEEWLNLL